MRFHRKQTPLSQLQFIIFIPGISVALLRTVTWAISNLCRNKNPSLPVEVVRMCMPTLLELTHHTDTEVLGKQLNCVRLCLVGLGLVRLGYLGKVKLSYLN